MRSIDLLEQCQKAAQSFVFVYARTGIRTPVIGLEGRDDIQTTLYGQTQRERISIISITVVWHIYDNEPAF